MTFTAPGSIADGTIVAGDVACAWRVRTGEAIVFVVELDGNGTPSGRRTFQAAVPAGGVIFGSSHETPAASYALLISAAPGALEPLRVTDLEFGERDEAIGSYLETLFAARSERGERGSEVALDAQRQTHVVDTGDRVVAGAPIAYARLVAGSVLYFDARITPGTVVALTPQFGLLAAEPSTIEMLGRPADVPASEALAALATAMDAMWSGWIRAAGAGDALRAARQQRTRERDEAAFERALDAAASVLDAGAIPLESGDDAIVVAARIVARASHIEIEAPSERHADTDAMVRAIAESSRIPIRRVSLRGRWWHREMGPLLGVRDGEPVALLPVHGGRRYALIDPKHPATRVLVTDAIAAQIEPQAYIFIRTLPARAISLGDIVAVAAPGGGHDLLRIVGFGFIAGLLGAVLPFAIGLVYGLVIPNGLRGSLGLVALGLVLVGGTATLVEIARNLLVLRLQTRASGSAQAAFMARLVSLPVAFFRRYAVGDLADRALAVESVQRYVTGATLSVTLGAVFSLSGFLVVVFYDARLALVCALLAAIAVGAALLEASITLPLYRDLSMRGGATAAYVLQLISGVAKLRVARAESRAFVGWLNRFIMMRRLSSRAGAIAYRFGIFQALWPGIATLTIVADVAVFRTQTISAAAFLAISAAFGQLLGSLLGLGDALTSIVRVVPIFERAKPLLEAIPEIHDGHGDPGRLTGALTLRRVAFSYSPGRRALEEIDLTIAPGEFVAIVGSSGSGKSTLFRLLLGFERPDEGALFYDGHDLATLDLGAVRRQIGCVLQTAKTIPGSLFDNIACGTILSHDEAWEAARAVGLAADIAQMPMRMETVIGDDGGGLSGGQRQRIIIARALAHKPRIVLFDEATSALDNQTQSIVTESLRSMRATRVVIAHRLSTIVDADRIVVLERGRIVQNGTYAGLAAVPGPFADLVSRQRI
jgi:NHLM bacteriocin system ABC transporter ATP-binding protein